MRFSRAALVLSLSGLSACAADFERLAGESDPIAAIATVTTIAQPFRLTIERPSPPFRAFQYRVQAAVRRETDRAVLHGPSLTDGKADYLLRLKLEASGRGRGINFLSCFPGFLVGMPSWWRLRWTLDLTTRIELRCGERQVGDVVVRHDRYTVTHTPGAMAGLAYSGWAAVFAPVVPIVALAIFDPIVAGAITASTPWHGLLQELSGKFVRSEEGKQLARIVAARVVAMIAADRASPP